MKIEGVIISDTKAGKFFAYVNQFPGICAQADSIEDVKSNVSRNFAAFIEKMERENVEFTQGEISIY